MARKKTANVYPRRLADGSVRYDTMLTFRDEATGRRKQKMVTFRTKNEALDALAQNRSDRARGQAVAPSKMTVGTLMDEWLAVHGATLRSTSVAQYESTIRKHIRPRLGHVSVQSLTAHDLEQHYAWMRQQGCGAVVVAHVHRRMQQALAYAVRHRWTAQNVARDASVPAYHPKRYRVWTEAELNLFLTRARDSRYGPIFVLAALTGLRRGELLGLRWSDLDAEAGLLHVRRGLVYRNREFEVHPTKTGREGTLAIPRPLVDLLLAHAARQKERLESGGVTWTEHSYMFTTHHGTPIMPQNLGSEFRAICQEAGLPRIRLHDIRHTHATWLLNHGWTVTDVAARLRHNTTTTTMNTYLHALPDRYGDMVAEMARDLGLT